MPAIFTALAFLFCLALPDQALAWGPGVHMITGNWLLQNLGALPPEIAAALMQHPGQFLHGILSADIFIGKGSKPKAGHSHNWENGFFLLDKAARGDQQAYAYGYLAHLAADVVAHNVYVPGLLCLAPGKGKTSHIYLEAQADRLLNWDSKDALGVFHERESRASLAMLRRSMRRASFPFWLNAHIFQGSIALGGSGIWRGSLRVLDRFFHLDGEGSLLDRMLVVSTRAMIALLREGKASRLLEMDPIGAEALALAAGHARNKNGRAARGLAQGMRRTFDRVLGREPDRARFLPPLRDLPRNSAPALKIPEVLDALPPICSPDDTHHE